MFKKKVEATYLDNETDELAWSSKRFTTAWDS